MTKQMPSTTFAALLQNALELVQQTATLGQESPLAVPYFLGDYLLQQPTAMQPSAVGRGNALHTLLIEALRDLPAHHAMGESYQRLLDLSYFQRPNKRSGDLWDQLGMSRATYFRERKKAIEVLESALIRHINPALRLEKPLQSDHVFGREQEVQSGIDALMKAQSVGIAGPSGVGKTTLAAYLLAQCPAQLIFWYTIYPGINDQLPSLLFALAYFLHRQGASTLWLQLLAERAQPQLESLVALLRNDLATIVDQAPIFCFDEVDLLQPELASHMQLLQFIESFPSGFGHLLIGQTVPMVTDHFIALSGLPTANVRQLVEVNGIRLEALQLEQLTKQTRGNPRLLKLYLALHHSGEPLTEALVKLKHAPSLETLLQRIWPRLPEAERDILLELAVYRRPAPIDVWPEPQQQVALQQLLHRQLIQHDGKGGIMLFAAYRRALYGQLTPEDREVLHAQAAQVRAFHQEITAAAYHWTQARDYASAVRVWYSHRERQIDQGQAGAALHIFAEISHTQLQNETDQQLLGLIRGELHKLLGNYTQAEATLQAITWRTPRLAAAARRLAGDVAELTGELARARSAYADGQIILETLIESDLVLLHRGMGWVYRRQKMLDDAWQEAQSAQYEVENLKGNILREWGDFALAETHYQQALQLAQELNNIGYEAKTRNAIASLLIKQGKFVEADLHFEHAYQLFRRLGRLLSVASVRVNQSVACMLNGRPAEAIPHALRAKSIFERLQHSYGVATVYQALAEAHLALGDASQAIQYAQDAMGCEEDTVIPDALRVIGEAQLALGDGNGAKATIEQAISAAIENRDRYLEAYAYRALAKVLVALEQTMEARQVLAQAISIFEEIQLPDEVKRSQTLL